MPLSAYRVAFSFAAIVGSVTADGSWHRDSFCAKYDIDARHDNRHTDGLGHGLHVDVDRLVKYVLMKSSFCCRLLRCPHCGHVGLLQMRIN